MRTCMQSLSCRNFNQSEEPATFKFPKCGARNAKVLKKLAAGQKVPDKLTVYIYKWQREVLEGLNAWHAKRALKWLIRKKNLRIGRVPKRSICFQIYLKPLNSLLHRELNPTVDFRTPSAAIGWGWTNFGFIYGRTLMQLKDLSNRIVSSVVVSTSSLVFFTGLGNNASTSSKLRRVICFHT